MEEEREEGGVSLFEILSMIWKRIIWILAISVAAALVLGLVAMFVISPSKEKYQLSFVIDYPNQFGAGSTDKLQYPDGTVFRFETAVFADNLEKAKNSDDELKSINTKKMSSSGDIAVSVPESSAIAGSYTITVAGKYFKSSEQATKFLQAICGEVKESIVEKAEGINYSTGLFGYENVATSEQKIEILQTQHLSVLAQYENYLKLYAKFSYEGKTLENYYSDALVLFERSDLVNIQVVIKNGEKEYHTKAYNALKQQMDELVKEGIISYEGLSSFTTKMAEHQEQIAMLNLEIERLGGDSTAEYVPASAEELEALYDAIVTETQTCEAVVSALYEENTVFRYEQSEVVKTGGVSTLKYALIAFVAAFVVACVVFCVADRARRRKAEQPVESVAEVIEAEAAVTETKQEKE